MFKVPIELILQFMDTTIRKLNIEFLRIICMLFIIWGHLTNQYSVNEPILGITCLETHPIKSFTAVAVNVFILIIGLFFDLI